MCGIAGVVVRESTLGARARTAVESMTRAVGHRGPDGRGVVDIPGANETRAFLGHTRLAIIDLSERAAQPMATSDGRYWLTYNGEIYNFRDIRRELEGLGESFVSDSDTEVLLKGYARWGASVVDRLDGMFAFAIWDAPR